MRVQKGRAQGRSHEARSLAARGERARSRLAPDEREFLDALISRSG